MYTLNHTNPYGIFIDEKLSSSFPQKSDVQTFKLPTPKPPLSLEFSTTSHLIQAIFLYTSEPPQRNLA